MSLPILPLSLALVLVVSPLWALYAVIRDVALSRMRASQLERLASGLRYHLRLLQESNIEDVRERLVTWLGSFADPRPMSWAQPAASLLSHTFAIVLGETSRPTLEQDPAYRLRVLVRVARVADALESGSPYDTMRHTAALMALAMCATSPQSLPAPRATVPTQTAADAIEAASNTMPQDLIAAYEDLTRALQAVAALGPSEESALPILTLKVAQIAVREPNPARDTWPDSTLRSPRHLSRLLRQIARALRSHDNAAVADRIYGPW